MTVTIQSSNPAVRDTENFSDRVYNQSKNLISCDEVLPGREFQHQQRGDPLNVGRTPAREALTRLAQEGYFTFLPNRVFTCKEISLQGADVLCDLREAVKNKKERKNNGSRFSY